jgi:hypothetical protein
MGAPSPTLSRTAPLKIKREHMNTITRIFLRASSVLIAAAAISSCNDPESDATKLFTDQGLTLLKPARSYIVPGGLVVLSGSGHPIYMDPLDDPKMGGNGVADGNEVDFQAVFAKVAKSNHTGLQLAVQLVSSVLPAAGEITFGSDTDVTMDQINSNGTHLVSAALKTYINQAATKAEISSWFVASGSNNRVFVVQDVYQSTSMTLKSTASKSFDIALTTGKIAACPAAPSSTGTDGSNGSAANSAGAGSNSSTTNSAGSAKPSTANSASTGSTNDNAGKSTGSGSSGASPTSASKPAAGSSGGNSASSKAGGSLAICLGPNNYSLTFNSSNPIPFAVRLVELNKDLTIKANGKPIPGALGSGIGEMSAQLPGYAATELVKVCPSTLSKSQCAARAKRNYN